MDTINVPLIIRGEIIEDHEKVKHNTKYLQPGLDLVTLDPKNSTMLIGREALADEETMREVARPRCHRDGRL
jgi:hypothetical protein